MKPLLFLTYRSLVNGIRRALTSPRRLLGFIFVVGYYFMFIVRPWLSSARSGKMNMSLPVQIDFPPLVVIEAFLFAGFAIMSFLLALGIISNKSTFKPADVDVLFPTPVSPKVVLVFRIVREYLVTLLIPFFFALFLYPPASAGWRILFKNAPDQASSSLALKTMSISWFLMAMCWVAISYAASLYVNRSDLKSDLYKKIINWGLTASFFGIGIYCFFLFRDVTSLSGVIKALHSPVLRIVFFLATASSNLTIAPLAHNVWQGLFGVALMTGVIIVSFRIAMSQVNWLYDQAAVKGFSQLESMKKRAQGDFLGLAVMRAQSGKRKEYRVGYLQRMRVKGIWALLWKDIFIQCRSFGVSIFAMMLPGVILSVMPAAMPSKGFAQFGPMVFIGGQVFSILMSTINTSISGFLETLRNVDILKPLPFSSMSIVSVDSIAKAWWAIVANLVGAIIAVILKPLWWQYILGSVLIVTPAFAFLISAMTLLITLIFPDADDSTQRQFHRIVMLIAMVVVSAPGVLVLILLLALPVFDSLPVIPCLIGGVVFLLFGIGTNYISSNLFAAYNPSD